MSSQTSLVAYNKIAHLSTTREQFETHAELLETVRDSIWPSLGKLSLRQEEDFYDTCVSFCKKVMLGNATFVIHNLKPQMWFSILLCTKYFGVSRLDHNEPAQDFIAEALAFKQAMKDFMQCHKLAESEFPDVHAYETEPVVVRRPNPRGSWKTYSHISLMDDYWTYYCQNDFVILAADIGSVEDAYKRLTPRQLQKYLEKDGLGLELCAKINQILLGLGTHAYFPYKKADAEAESESYDVTYMQNHPAVVVRKGGHLPSFVPTGSSPRTIRDFSGSFAHSVSSDGFYLVCPYCPTAKLIATTQTGFSRTFPEYMSFENGPWISREKLAGHIAAGAMFLDNDVASTKTLRTHHAWKNMRKHMRRVHSHETGYPPLYTGNAPVHVHKQY